MEFITGLLVVVVGLLTIIAVGVVWYVTDSTVESLKAFGQWSEHHNARRRGQERRASPSGDGPERMRSGNGGAGL